MLVLMLQNRSPDFNTLRLQVRKLSNVFVVLRSAPFAIGASEEGAEIFFFRCKCRAQTRNEGIVLVPSAAGHGDQLKLAYQRADVDSCPLCWTRADGGLHRGRRQCR